MKIVVTGAAGLIGWHTSVRIHAANCAAAFAGKPAPFELVRLDHSAFEDEGRLQQAVSAADAVIHCAGVNRAPEDALAEANPAIAQRLVDACGAMGSKPHIVYANSTHAAAETAYGRSKRRAAEILTGADGHFTNLILPHVFGECARPRYNNVTATFIEAVIQGTTPDINPTGRVELLHAGAAAQTALNAVTACQFGDLRPTGQQMSVADLFEMLNGFHASYQANTYPDLRDDFALALFNSYRAALYPGGFPKPLTLNTDPRGTLFESVKSISGGQCFFSTTEPGVTRGDHFHLNKVERFLVVEGEATIRIRKALSDTVWEYQVSGKTPAAVDMPTLHTHSIENIGKTPLLTLFWTHDLFDPENPDTFADKVLR